jgi:putative YphP/YqiW family bacilliredoxin
MARPPWRSRRESDQAGQATTVFAGQDADATQRAREYFTGYPPSSPQIALFGDGDLVFMLERWQIEGRPAEEIAHDLVNAFNRYRAA